jgi:hypothetical protein
VGSGPYHPDLLVRSVVDMENTTHTAPATTPLDDPRVRSAFAAVKNSITVYGALGVVALAAVVVVASSGQPVNTFMWVRAALLPVIAVLVHRMAVAGSGGSRRAFERLSALSLVMPIAIVGVDLIPGVCPVWYAVLQAVCMLPVVRVAFLVRGPVLRPAFAAR